MLGRSWYLAPFWRSDDGSGGSGGGAAGAGADSGGTDGGAKDGGAKDGGDPGGGAAGGGGFKPITSQDEFDAALASRLARQERTLREALTTEIRASLDAQAATDAAKKNGEWEKLAATRQTEIDRLAAENATLIRDGIVARIAAKHKLPADVAKRLQGSTESEIEDDAKAIAKFVRTESDASSGGKGPDNEGGKGNSGKGGKPPAPAHTFRSGRAVVKFPGRASAGTSGS